MEHYPKKEKEQLRQSLLKKRRKLTKTELIKKSEAIHSSLFNLIEYQKADCIHTYLSIKKNGEVLTDPLIESSLASGKQIIVPRVEKENQLSHHIIRSLDELNENRWGVREPARDHITDPNKSDMIIVPMVGGDRQKNRLGYGKGYYDRFLSKVNSPIKIGLLFDFTLSSKPLPVEEFDVPLDILITESEIIR